MNCATDAEVQIGLQSGVGRIRLNRPKALHALTTDMCRRITEALLAWREDPAVKLVMIDHAGERGFCSGGDIRMLAESGRGDGVAACAFFFVEYQLNELLFGYAKPVVAVMDGVTMGGGVGLAVPCRYRIATERTTFAMPETGIGLFPDVGAGWHLSRLPDQMGLWLALTGARIRAADCLFLGLATTHVQSSRLEALKAALAAEPEAVERILGEFHTDSGDPPLAERRAAIAAAFGGGSVEEILASLEAAGDAWSREQVANLADKSPQALKVTFRQQRLGAQAPGFAANMAMEYRIASRVVRSADFLEGVRAVILDKDGSPKWSPATLDAFGEPSLDAIFAPLPAGQEWSPLEAARA